jgi:hypothetical protein
MKRPEFQIVELGEQTATNAIPLRQKKVVMDALLLSFVP